MKSKNAASGHLPRGLWRKLWRVLSDYLEVIGWGVTRGDEGVTAGGEEAEEQHLQRSSSTLGIAQ